MRSEAHVRAAEKTLPFTTTNTKTWPNLIPKLLDILLSLLVFAFMLRLLAR